METTHQGLSTSDVWVIDHGLDTMKFYVNYTCDLETSNIQGQGHR